MGFCLRNKVAALALSALAGIALPGCDRKEKILDIEAPGVDVEVERDKDTGAVGVDVDGGDD